MLALNSSIYLLKPSENVCQPVGHLAHSSSSFVPHPSSRPADPPVSCAEFITELERLEAKSNIQLGLSWETVEKVHKTKKHCCVF